MDPLSRLLAAKRVVLADGAMGTSLFARGLETGGSPELWNLEQPDQVRAVHQGFVDAGSDLLLTNSFGANRRRLALHGAEERVAELNRAAARLAREAADARVDRCWSPATSGRPARFSCRSARSASPRARRVRRAGRALAEGGVDCCGSRRSPRPKSLPLRSRARRGLALPSSPR